MDMMLSDGPFMFANPADHPRLSAKEAEIVRSITASTKEYFNDPRFDASHDFEHVQRVVNSAIVILESLRYLPRAPEYDLLIVILGALLHDVGDKKYFGAEEQETSKILDMLAAVKVTGQKATRIQRLVEGVSYSSEVKDPNGVAKLIQEIPELAIVQDADRLDAIGAVGIARCFTFGAKMQARSLADSLDHFNDKLFKLEGMMKTNTGKAMAQERSSRIRLFMKWWQDESGPINSGEA